MILIKKNIEEYNNDKIEKNILEKIIINLTLYYKSPKKIIDN